MALCTPNYVAQSFDQDAWMTIEGGLSGQDAVAALVATGRMNVDLFRSLPAEARRTGLSHPEYDMPLTVDWIIRQLAGHQIHHWTQIEQAALR